MWGVAVVPLRMFPQEIVGTAANQTAGIVEALVRAVLLHEFHCAIRVSVDNLLVRTMHFQKTYC